MRGINKVILLGNVGRAPETRYTHDGRPITSFAIATSRVYMDKAGERQEETEWHKVVSFGKLAEVCGQYLEKGRPVYLEGRLQTRQWNGQNGEQRSSTEVLLDTIQLLSRGTGGATRAQVPSGQIASEEATPF